ncbi:MAG: ATP-binding protein [Bacteroidia bacterium]
MLWVPAFLLSSPLMKLPYGISDFARLRRDGYYYQDRTSYIPVLESLGEPYLIFLRPRRFGKSLWLSTLAHYYGREHAKDFEWLFKGLAVGEQPTPRVNSYLVLSLDFSRIDTSSREETKQGFTRNVVSGIRQFLLRYQAILPDLDPDKILAEEDASNSIQNLFTALTGTDHRIYLLIDEYDHFTNQLIGPDLRHFQEIVTGTGYVRKFYESIKTATGQGTVERIFMTGVSPVTLDSLTSGFNISKNFSRSPLLNELMGFREQEVEALLEKLGQLNVGQLGLLRSWYNGYRFHEAASESIYNPDMVLYYATEHQHQGCPPQNMLDTNIASDYGRIRQLFRLGGREARHFELLQELLAQREIRTQITAQFSFEKTFTDVDFLSLLYYAGMLTMRGNQLGIPKLVIPNKVIEKLYYDYFGDFIARQTEQRPAELRVQDAVVELAMHNGPHPLLVLVSDTLLKLSNRDWLQFDEASIKAILVSYLHAAQLYFIRSEPEFEQRYVDLLLQRREPFPAPHQFAFELKYLKKKDAGRLDEVVAEARTQLQGYLQSELLRSLSDLRAWVVVFVGTEVGYAGEVGKP